MTNFFYYLRNKAKKNKINVLSFGYSKNADVRLLKNKKDILEIKVQNETLSFKAKNISNLNIINLLCLLTVLKSLQLDLYKTKNFSKHLEYLSGRGKIHRIKRFKSIFNLIDESYNANPYSVRNAIKRFSNIDAKYRKKYLKTKRKISTLGSQKNKNIIV